MSKVNVSLCRPVLVICALLAMSLSAYSQQNFTTTAAFDELGQLERFDYPDGSYVTYEYDNEVGLASSITYHSGNTSFVFVEAIELNQSGLLSKVRTDGGEKSYSFDSLNQLVESKFVHNRVTRYLATGFTYNHRGSLKGLARSDPSVSGNLRFEYTEQGQLRTFGVDSKTATYRYDNQGNMTSISGFKTNKLSVPDYDSGGSAFDERNHNENWLYDGSGRVLKDDTRAYQYDLTGRLALVRDLTTGIPLESYLYDTEGRRVRKTDIKAGSVTYFVRDGTGIVVTERVESSGGPASIINYINHNGRIIGKISYVEGENEYEKTEIFNDYLGSPTVVIKGDQVFNYEYAPFGNQIGSSKNIGTQGYTGHEDDATLLTYMQARYNDSTSVRFLTPDPARAFGINLPVTMNLYEYVSNDPMNMVDPYGLVETGREWADRLAGESFSAGGEFKGYAYKGLSGFLGTADGISKVANYWVFGKKDELSSGDYFSAALNVTEILPAFKFAGLKNVGKIAGTTDDLAGALSITKGGIGPVLTGQAGEALAGITKIKKRIDSLTGKANYRIPDELTPTTLREIKNVSKLSLTGQLVDFLQWAQYKNLEFILEVRKTTKLSKPLQELVDNGVIILKRSL